MSSHYRNSRPSTIDTSKIRASFVRTDNKNSKLNEFLSINNLYSKNWLTDIIISIFVILISSLLITVLLYKKRNPEFQLACLQYLTNEQKIEFKSLFNKVVFWVAVFEFSVRTFIEI